MVKAAAPLLGKICKHKHWRGSQPEKAMEAAPVIVFARTMLWHFKSGLRNLFYREQAIADFSPIELG